MSWKDRAIEILRSSLTPIPHELSELDWKSGLSPKSERLAQHVCAFCNHRGGGMFAFGINDDASFSDLDKEHTDAIIKKLGNIAHNNLSCSVDIDHAILEYEGHAVLFVFVPEQREKPIFIKGKDYRDAFCRSTGQTVRMSSVQVRNAIATSQGLKYVSSSSSNRKRRNMHKGYAISAQRHLQHDKE